MRFHLRQVEVRAAALFNLLATGTCEVQHEVDDRTGDRSAVNEDVLFGHVPAAGAHDDGGQLFVGTQLVFLAGFFGNEVDFAVGCVKQVDLPADDGVPRGSVGVFLVCQPRLGAGVERVDRHLAVRGAGDLNTAVFQAGGGRRHLPGLVFADGLGLFEEVEFAAFVEELLAFDARGQAVLAFAFVLAVQVDDELQGLSGEDLGVFGLELSGDFHAFGQLQFGSGHCLSPIRVISHCEIFDSHIERLGGKAGWSQ